MYTLNEFLSRKAEDQARDEAVALWHIAAHVDGGVPLPYSHDETWVNVNVYDTTGENGWELDAEKSIEVLAKIAKYASKIDGLTIAKNYQSSDFELSITFPLDRKNPDGETITMRYHANREAVCTKRVIGEKIIPERVVPERIEEEVEWDCDAVSLLARNTSDAA